MIYRRKKAVLAGKHPEKQVRLLEYLIQRYPHYSSLRSCEKNMPETIVLRDTLVKCDLVSNDWLSFTVQPE